MSYIVVVFESMKHYGMSYFAKCYPKFFDENLRKDFKMPIVFEFDDLNDINWDFCKEKVREHYREIDFERMYGDDWCPLCFWVGEGRKFIYLKPRVEMKKIESIDPDGAFASEKVKPQREIRLVRERWMVCPCTKRQRVMIDKEDEYERSKRRLLAER